MGQLLKLLPGLSLLLLTFIIPQDTNAAPTIVTQPPESQINESTPSVTISYAGLKPNTKYTICLGIEPGSNGTRRDFCEQESVIEATTDGSGGFSITVCAKNDRTLKTGCDSQDYFHVNKTYKTAVFEGEKNDFHSEYIGNSQFTVSRYYPDVAFFPERPKPTDDISIRISGSRMPKDNARRNNYYLLASWDKNRSVCVDLLNDVPNQQGFGTLPEGRYTISVVERIDEDTSLPWQAIGLPCKGLPGFVYYSINFTVDNQGGSHSITKDPQRADRNSPGFAGENPCGPEGASCPTAFGNISTDPKAFASRILSIATGIGGGIALILMVIGSVRVLTSSGDQQKLSGGRDMIVAAVAGLLFIIFSVLILRFIGLNILGII